MSRQPADALTRQEQLALAEIDLCQAHVQVSSERTWETESILLAGAMASLVLMLQISSSPTAAAIMSTVLGVGAIFILQLWKDLVRREEALRHQSVARMKEIERELGFQREARVGEQDDRWPRMRVPFLKIPFPVDTSHTEALETTGTVVQIGWVLVPAWRWLIVAGLLG